MTETTTFRAAYLPSSDGGGTLLTLPEHATLGQESLLAVAREEMARGGVDGTPEIGTWEVAHDPCKTGPSRHRRRDPKVRILAYA